MIAVRRLRTAAALAVAIGLGACSSTPPRTPAAAGGRPAVEPAIPELVRDGPDISPPPGLAQLPDAEPRIEPVRPGGPNKPYEALGQAYVPVTRDAPFRQRGMASWYGRKFHGRRTASGEVYDMYAMTAAHPTLPIPSYVRVRNPANAAEVVLRINDRGPFHGGRIVDLSYAAALKLGVLRGVAPVELERITFDDIRSGAWRRGPAPVLAQAAPPPVAEIVASDAPAFEPVAPMISATSAATATSPGGFWVQLAAFQQRAGAEGFHRRVAADVDWLAPLLTVFSDASLFRLQAGPYASRDEAQSVAQRVREALKLVPLVLERR